MSARTRRIFRKKNADFLQTDGYAHKYERFRDSETAVVQTDERVFGDFGGLRRSQRQPLQKTERVQQHLFLYGDIAKW